MTKRYANSSDLCPAGHVKDKTNNLGYRYCSVCHNARRVVTRAQRDLPAPVAGRSPRVSSLVCKAGHPWLSDNVRIDARGQRQCVACERARSRPTREERRVETAARNVRKACLTCGSARDSERAHCNSCRSDARRLPGSAKHGDGWVRADGSKRCESCREVLDARDFYANSSQPDGLMGSCAACLALRQAVRRVRLANHPCGQATPAEVRGLAHDCPCGALGVELDHVVPVVRNGCAHVHNLQWLCMRCNRSKHDKLPPEGSGCPAFWADRGRVLPAREPR